MTNGGDNLLQHAIEQAIRADEKAKSAHERLDRTDDAMTQFRVEMNSLTSSIGELRVAVGKINTKVAMAATLGAVLGSAIVGAVLRYYGI